MKHSYSEQINVIGIMMDKVVAPIAVHPKPTELNPLYLYEVLNDCASSIAALNLSDPYKEIERLKSELLERDASWLPAKDAEIERLQNQVVELKKHLSHYADVNQNQ